MSLRQAQHEAPVAGGIAARRIACVNDSDEEVPVYSIVAAPGGVTKPDSNSTREYLKIDYPTGSDDALFVTMGKKLNASSPGIYGHIWSVLSGPLWVNYEGDNPSVGDTVGPKADSFKVSTDGDGFKVLQVDTTKKRVRVVWTGGCKSKLVKTLSEQSADGIVECAQYTGAYGAETTNGTLVTCYVRGVSVDADIWGWAAPLCAVSGQAEGGGTSSVSADGDHPSGKIGPADHEFTPLECNA